MEVVEGILGFKFGIAGNVLGFKFEMLLDGILGLFKAISFQTVALV